MSVSANQILSRRDDCRGFLKVAASTRLYQNTLVFNASGYGADTTGSGANKFEGIAIDDVDNSAGTAGAKTAEVYREGIFPLTGSGFSQATVGKRIFATDNFTVTADGSAAGAKFVGRCVNYVSATVIDVDIMPEHSDAADDRTFTISIPVLPHATLTEQNLFTAREALQVLSIDMVPDLVQGGTLTGTVCKASGTATPANGTTPMHNAGGLNFNATAHTVQPATLTSTAADLVLAAGDRIGLDLSAALTTGRANITIRLKRL